MSAPTTASSEATRLSPWLERHPPNPGDPAWRAEWVREICRALHRTSYGPVDPDSVTCGEIADPSPAIRLSYARGESAGRLRTTLHAAAWAGALDVCGREAQLLAEWHRRAWGIREAVSDDVSIREHQVQLVVKRVVRQSRRVTQESERP
jgi:hypothetical protein